MGSTDIEQTSEFERVDVDAQELALEDLRIKERQAERDSKIKLMQQTDHSWTHRAGLVAYLACFAFLAVYISITKYHGTADSWATSLFCTMVGAMAGYYFRKN